MSKTENGLFIRESCIKYNLPKRLDDARILYQLVLKERIDKKSWSNLMRVPYTNYIAFIKQKRPIPMTVWFCLYDFNFSIEWFLSGEGYPFRNDITFDTNDTSYLTSKDKDKLIKILHQIIK